MDSWRDLADCASLPVEAQKAFFGEAQKLSTEKQHEQARIVCYQCPVQVACLSYCIDTDTDFGVWGGLTESQRKRYLWPALRRLGRSDWVLEKVIEERGTTIFRLIERRTVKTLPQAPTDPPPEYSPPLTDRLRAALQA